MARALVVEDSPTQALMLELMLAEGGYECEVFPEASGALRRFNEAEFDVVISDVLMPGMTGYELCHKIRNEQGSDVPFILVTVLEGMSDVLKGLESGADVYLRKPYQAEELIERISQVVANRRPGGVPDDLQKTSLWVKGEKFTLPTDQKRALGYLSTAFVDLVVAKQTEHELAITERNRVEADLRRSEEKFSAFAGLSSEGMVISDREGIILSCSPGAEQMFGYGSNELLDAPLTTLIPERYRDDHVAGFGRALATNRLAQPAGKTLELHGLRKDETEFPLELSINTWETGGQLFFAGLMRDISPRQRAAEDMQRNAADYGDLLRQAQYGFYRMSPAGRARTANPAMISMLGYDSEEEIVSLDFASNLFTDQAQHQAFIYTLETTGRVTNLEVEWRRKDEEAMFVCLSGTTVRDLEGKLVCHEIVAEDVTERRRLEEQLRQAQKIQALGQVVGGGGARLQQRTDPQLLGFSREETLTIGSVDLSEELVSITTRLRRFLPESIEIETRVETVATVRADVGAIEQIILNLATNARDAMPDGGALRLQTHRAWIDQAHCDTYGWGSPGEFACISVSDTGSGMDEETKQRLFEHFFTTKPEGSGSGLGMPMILGLMRQHGGFVYVYSELGQGTTVKIYFPIVQGGVNAAVPMAEQELPRGSEMILFVEDEEKILRMAKRTLEDYGYQVLEAATGEEALEQFKVHEGQIDLVISDMVMPKMGGRELLESLRAQGTTARFIMSSGYTARDVRAEMGLDRSIPFLPKPWTVPDLLRRVRDVLEGGGL